jgi:hypothetical protein
MLHEHMRQARDPKLSSLFLGFEDPEVMLGVREGKLLVSLNIAVGEQCEMVNLAVTTIPSDS